ncbi:MAG: hypothetical protein AAFQ95_04030, partial [Cyanobacteria bacterium J06621_3]
MKKSTFSALLALPLLAGTAIGLSHTAFAQSWGIDPSTESTNTEVPAPETPAQQSPSTEPGASTPTPSDREAPIIADISEFNQYGQVIERTKSMLRDP